MATYLMYLTDIKDRKCGVNKAQSSLCKLDVTVLLKLSGDKKLRLFEPFGELNT
jgi:hypothetical protein